MVDLPPFLLPFLQPRTRNTKIYPMKCISRSARNFCSLYSQLPGELSSQLLGWLFSWFSAPDGRPSTLSSSFPPAEDEEHKDSLKSKSLRIDHGLNSCNAVVNFQIYTLYIIFVWSFQVSCQLTEKRLRISRRTRIGKAGPAPIHKKNGKETYLQTLCYNLLQLVLLLLLIKLM